VSRLPFLTTPGVWVRASSRQSDPVRDACAIERSKPSTNPVASVMLAVVIGIAIALLLIHELAGG
jgi:hypothetical protein